MDRDQRLALLEDARAELREARAQLASLNRRVLQLTQVVSGLSGLLDEQDPDEDEGLSDIETLSSFTFAVQPKTAERDRRDLRRAVHPPRPREAVMDVLTVRPDTPLAPKDVVELVRRAGMFNPNLKSGSNGYTTALNRLADEPGSGVIRDDEGRYVFRPEQRGLGASLSGAGTLFAGGSAGE